MKPIRILFLAANPKDTTQLRLSEEVRTIDERLRTAEFRDNFELIQHWAVRETDLAEALLRHRPHIVHFSGHGSAGGQIILENRLGNMQPVLAQALSDLFGILSDNIRCVVLNACLSQGQAEAIVQHIDCVVGMSRAISDPSAVAFAGGFYRGLGWGRSVEVAFRLGCNEIDLASLGEPDTPKLLTRTGVNPADVYLLESDSAGGRQPSCDVSGKDTSEAIKQAPTTYIQPFTSEQEVKRQPAPRPPQHLIDEIAARNVIPMIGAGLSISSRIEGTNIPVMPDYHELLERLTKEAEKLGCGSADIQRIRLALASGDTKSAARDLASVMGYDLYRILRSILNPIDDRIIPSLAHKLLRTLGFRHIITTNYDRLLEKFVGPQYEVITPMDETAFQFFTESLREHSADRYILKMHGDITRPETIFWGEEKLRGLYEGDVTALHDFLAEIFTRNTVVFLGYSFQDESEGYVHFLRKYVALKHGGEPVRRHYALVPHDPASKTWRGLLTKETGIMFLEYVPDESHSQVWEFVSFLNTGKRDEPVAGGKWAQWYLPPQRHDYLKRQLSLERTARSVRFLTPSLTNAISTDEHLDVSCRSEMKRARLIPNDEENTRYVDQEVIPLMFDRRNNLGDGLRKGRLEVEALCLRSELDGDFIEPSRVTVERHRYLISLLRDPTIDLRVRLIPDLTSDHLRRYEATYALIYSDSPKPQADVAIAYASQSTAGCFQIHMIEINTEIVKDRVFQFERFWASAWSEQDSMAYFERLVSAGRSS